MPIEGVKVFDGSCSPKESTGGMTPTKSGHNADVNRLRALIKKEENERKAEDNNLQKQIDTKQENIKFITVTELEGTLDEEMLNLLIENKINRLVYGDLIYYLSIVEEDIRKYFSKIQSSVYNEIDVNVETGDYHIISKSDPLVQEHIDNIVIHITQEEREFWNNKVTASTVQIDTGDYNLLLSKD